MGRLLLFFLIFPFYVMGQDKQGSNYRVTIADSSYETIYTKTNLSGFVQAIIKKGKQEELNIKTNIICDTSLSEAYILNPHIPASLKYIVNCFDYISFVDTLGSRNIIGLEKLINNEIFIFKDSLKIIPATVDVCLLTKIGIRCALTTKHMLGKGLESLYVKKREIFM